MHSAHREADARQRPGALWQVNYDPLARFAAATLLTEIAIVLVVHPSTPVRSICDPIAVPKSHPGKLNFGSSSNGCIGAPRGRAFQELHGTTMVQVPYKGNVPASVDLTAGVPDLTFSDLAGAGPYIKDAKMRRIVPQA